ncbi:MAG TPA: tetratricopeptide repeat protein, partial [Polyangiaceae bacterium]|nr:tetratricopeptide repeat protein [Polyangiaceae bacterium]
CRAHPVLFILEDLHWGDAPSVAFVDAALRALHDLPLTVLALARPEVGDLFPALWAERDVEHVRLRPLGARAAEQLSRDALGAGADDATVHRIVERAAGNALYLEELIRAVAEGDDALPETVLAMVHARLERLEPPTRHVLRAASVFGETFWEGGVRALVGDGDVAGALELLAHRELVTLRRQGRFDDEREYVFRHSIVREGANAMLTDHDRAVGHQLAGAWLEGKGERDAALLADHFEHGGDRARAATWNARAAKQALDANDIDGALARAARAETCGVAGPDLGALRVVQAAAQSWRGDTLRTLDLGSRAMELLPPGSAEWCSAAAYVIQGAGQAGHIDRVEGVAEELLAHTSDAATSERAMAVATAAIHLQLSGRFERANTLLRHVEALAAHIPTGDSLTHGQIAMLHHVRATTTNDYDGIVEHAHAAIERFERAGAIRKACVARNDLGDAYMTLGLWDRAEQVLREVLETCERIGIGTTAWLAQANLALVLARRGRTDDALALVTKALVSLHHHSNPRLEGGVRVYLATILALAGDLEGAAREASAASEMLVVAPPMRPLALATLARIELQRGHRGDALAAARAAMDLLDARDGACEGQSIVRLAWVEALRASGRAEEAQRAAELARAALLARSSKIRNEEMRASFLAVEEHARTLALSTTP